MANLAIMTLVWLTTAFNYYLIKFMINTFQQVYITGLASSLTGLVAYWHGGVLYQQLGLKTSLCIVFCISSLACISLLMYGLDHQSSWLFPVLVVFAEYGIAASFTIIYTAHSSIFPVLFSATALGLCNFVSRAVAAIAPVLAT